MSELRVELFGIADAVTNGAQDVMLGFGRGEGDELRQPPRRPSEPLLDSSAIALMSATLGIGGALILGLQAGLLAFIPTIGPLIAGGVLMVKQGTPVEGVMAAIFGVVIAGSFIEMGVSRVLPFIKRLITPLVTGIVVLMIGLTLIKVGLISMGGGYIMMGVVKGVLAAGRGLNKLTGGPDQIQSAIARPPPELSAEQRQRALRSTQPALPPTLFGKNAQR